MIRPFAYNIPEGLSEEEAFPDEILQILREVFQGVANAFGDNATLYRVDLGLLYASVQGGEPVVAGQFVDKSDGEIFDFEINQGTNKVGYKSTGNFLDKHTLELFLGEEDESGDGDANNSESSNSGAYPVELLLEAINEESSEAYQSPFASKLRKDLDLLGALSAAMYHAAVTIEAQPLYTGLHSYAIKYAFRGLRLFSQSIGSIHGERAGKSAENWVDEHGLDFAAAVIKEFSSRRCVRFQEGIQSGDQARIQELKDLVEEAVGMAMATTTELIKIVVEADDYQDGDVQATLTAAIDEYCPIDNSEGYGALENARQLSAEWQEVVSRSGCNEDMSMEALGLPSAETIPSGQRDTQIHQIEPASESHVEDEETPDGERIFYVNVGEGPSRNWDDCRKFGFLAAGGGRKWSKQLVKIQIGDTVIAYLKGYGYVGIGRVTSTATPATKFMVNGVLIKELPLINDTIRSIKRFSKENGEYLIGVDWQVAVPREQAAWKANAGLFTTALVCASLKNQQPTIDFVYANLFFSGVITPIVEGMTSDRAIEKLSALADDEESDQDIESVLEKLITQQWLSDEEYARFFVQVSLNMYDGLAESEAILFDRPITYSFCPGTTIWDLWTKARKLLDVVERISDEDRCIKPEMIDHFNITSIFNILPAALNASYDNQSLGEWLAHGIESYSHEDNEFFCIFIALIEDNDNALRDITSNLRNSIVLEELVLSRPELIASEEFLVEGYCSNGLLYNRSLSSFSLTYLSSLLIGTSLGLDGAASGKINSGTLTVDESDVICFREEHEDTLAEMDLEGIADLIRAHSNCSPQLAKALSK